MQEIKQQAVLLALLEAMREHGSWRGETHLQKCTFFLQEGLSVPLDFDFVLYKHGPFSFDLHELLGEMRAKLLVKLSPQYPYGPSLEPGPSSNTLKTGFPRTIALYSSQINFVAERIAPRSVVDLERVGTALYVTRQNPSSSPSERARLVTELKPHISDVLALSAVHEVDKLLTEAKTCRAEACV